MLSITRGNTPVTEPTYLYISWGVLTGSRNPWEVLQSVFGHTEFRTGQILNGEDAIAVIPTGGGRTVVYVLPCIMKPGLAVVISPLMMLMCDQVTRLQGYGITLATTTPC